MLRLLFGLLLRVSAFCVFDFLSLVIDSRLMLLCTFLRILLYPKSWSITYPTLCILAELTNPFRKLTSRFSLTNHPPTSIWTNKIEKWDIIIKNLLFMSTYIIIHHRKVECQLLFSFIYS